MPFWMAASSWLFSRLGRQIESEYGLLSGQIGQFGGRACVKVNGIEGRVFVDILGHPVEDARLLVDFSALSIMAAVAHEHLHARVANEGLLTGLFVDFIQVAVGGHTVECVILGHTQGHIGMLQGAKVLAVQGGIVHRAQHKSCGVAVVEHAIVDPRSHVGGGL